MSRIAAATLDDVLGVTPFSIKEEVKQHGDERRAHVRLSAEEIEWLRQVRLKSGPRVTLIDLSRGGALIDSRVHMRPGSTITLELAGQEASLELTSQVLRCHLAHIGGNTPIYRGACMFAEPLGPEDPRDVVLVPAPQPSAIEGPGTAGAASAAWQKIVARYRDGSTVKGYTLDFHPSRYHFSLWPSVNATRHERVIVPLAVLKAVFFVKDFTGDPTRDKRAAVREDTTAGRRIEVTFVDGEVIRGTTLAYRSEASGFFVVPFDGSGNNQRVFVTRTAVRHVRFP